MYRPPRISCSIILCTAVLAGCATTHPVAYQGLASSWQPYPNPQNAGHVPFLYTADDVNWLEYNSVVLDPVTVYDGPDQQFGNASQADEALLTEYAHRQITQALATKYTVAGQPGLHTLRIRVTLTGFEPNTPGASRRLLRAYVTKEYPAAENIGASFGALDASKAGIRKGAQGLLKWLT
jgi:hypothetical protein